MNKKQSRRTQITSEEIATRLHAAAKVAEEMLRPPDPPAPRSRPDPVESRERASHRCRAAMQRLFKGINGESVYIHPVTYGLGFLGVVTVGYQRRGGNGPRWDPPFVYLHRTIEIYLDPAAPLVRIPESDRNFRSSATFERYLVDELLPEIAGALATCRIAHSPKANAEAPDTGTSTITGLLQCMEHEAREIAQAVPGEHVSADILRRTANGLAELTRYYGIEGELKDHPLRPGWVSYRARTEYLALVVDEIESFLSSPQAQEIAGAELLRERLKKQFDLQWVASELPRASAPCATVAQK